LERERIGGFVGSGRDGGKGGVMCPSIEQRDDIERDKLAVDCVKHITTLATASILAMPVILDKFTVKNPDTNLLRSGLVLMVACIAASALYLFFIGIFRFAYTGKNVFTKFLIDMVIFLIYATFFSGISSIGLFIYKNSK
jgi:hypothetical protein